MASRDPSSEFIDKILLDSNVRALFEKIPNLHFFIKDRSGRLVFCNDIHRHGLFRFQDSKALYGKENYDFFPAILAAAFAEDDRFVIQTGKTILDRVELNITNSGALSWFCTTKIPAVDANGKVIGLIGISRRLEKADQRLNEFSTLIPSIEYIHENYASKISLGTLAHRCHMTEVTFRRNFKQLFRMTPVKFILRMRLHEACTLLSARKESVGEVSFQCGFEDQNYFARQFKLLMGVSPTEYRESKRQRTQKNIG